MDPRYKARLLACGYDQLYGVDYLTTYSPVVKDYSIRLALSISAAFNLEMLQLDIKTAFLYEKLEEKIFMRQPEGYVIPGREEVCNLKKPIYGLNSRQIVGTKNLTVTSPNLALNAHNMTGVYT